MAVAVATWGAWTASVLCASDTPLSQLDSVTQVKLNGLAITLDSCTGAILRLDYPGPGTLLEADATEAGLVDVAYPLEQF